MIYLDLDRATLADQAAAYEREADYAEASIRIFGPSGFRDDPRDLRHRAACIRAKLAQVAA